MTGAAAPRLMIEAMAKHLPPSASTLRLVDVGGAVGEVLLERRADLDVIAVAGDTWDLDDNSLDAVTAYGTTLERGLLRMALRALRPGGRLIVVDPHGESDAEQVRTLEEVGKIFSVTRERVRQIEAKAVRKLQHPVRCRPLVSFVDKVNGTH